MSPDPVCQSCVHLREKLVADSDTTCTLTCAAYPHGIPDKWMLEEHSEVQKDQVGTFMFKERA